MKTDVSGIVIQEAVFGESDKIITILTREKGIISAVAKKCRNIKSKSSASVQLFSYCKFSLYEGKKMYIVNETEVKKIFWGLRENLNHLSLACYFCELCRVLSPDESVSAEMLRLMLNSLFYLSENKIRSRMLKSIFELRSCSVCGYMPNLVGCCKCKTYNSQEMAFNIENGIIICEKCRDFSLKSAENVLSPGALAALRHIIYSPMEKLFAFKILPETLYELSEICERYVFTHVKSDFKSLGFYKSIKNQD